MYFDTAPTLENPLWPLLVAAALVVLHLFRKKGDGTTTDTGLSTILTLLGKTKLPVIGAIVGYLLTNSSLMTALNDLWNKLAGKEAPVEPEPVKPEEKKE